MACIIGYLIGLLFDFLLLNFIVLPCYIGDILCQPYFIVMIQLYDWHYILGSLFWLSNMGFDYIYVLHQWYSCRLYSIAIIQSYSWHYIVGILIRLYQMASFFLSFYSGHRSSFHYCQVYVFESIWPRLDVWSYIEG